MAMRAERGGLQEPWELPQAGYAPGCAEHQWQVHEAVQSRHILCMGTPPEGEQLPWGKGGKGVGGGQGASGAYSPRRGRVAGACPWAIAPPVTLPPEDAGGHQHCHSSRGSPQGPRRHGRKRPAATCTGPKAALARPGGTIHCSKRGEEWATGVAHATTPRGRNGRYAIALLVLLSVIPPPLSSPTCHRRSRSRRPTAPDALAPPPPPPRRSAGLVEFDEEREPRHNIASPPPRPDPPSTPSPKLRGGQRRWISVGLCQDGTARETSRRDLRQNKRGAQEQGPRSRDGAEGAAHELRGRECPVYGRRSRRPRPIVQCQHSPVPPPLHTREAHPLERNDSPKRAGGGRWAGNTELNRRQTVRCSRRHWLDRSAWGP